MRTHTGPRFIVSSEGRESHQPQVIRASHTNSKILVPEPGREPQTFRIGVGRATTAPLALSTIFNYNQFVNCPWLVSWWVG
jgi:hypothetical protein